MKTLILGTMLVLNNIVNPGHKLFSKQAKGKRRGMALIKLGGGVADIRGSIGGTVYSRNRYGAYARNRTIPVDPSSTAQQKIRSVMGSVKASWFETLTVAQRAAWEVYAANVAMTNRIGETMHLTGWNHFSRSASALLYNDMDIVAAGPTEFSLAEQDATLAIVVSEAAQTIAVTFDDTEDWCDEDGAALLIYASKPQSPTINFFKGPYLTAGKIEGDSVAPPTTGDTVAVPFACVEGQRIFVQCRIVRADGRLSEPFRTNVLVVA